MSADLSLRPLLTSSPDDKDEDVVVERHPAAPHYRQWSGARLVSSLDHYLDRKYEGCKTRRELWTIFLSIYPSWSTNELALRYPGSYLHERGSYALKIGSRIFRLAELKELFNATVDAAMCTEISHGGIHDLRTVQVLRYLFQDFINYTLYDYEPEFKTGYLKNYTGRFDRAAKADYFEFREDNRVIYLTARQYFKVITKNGGEERDAGFDMFKMEFKFYLDRLRPGRFLLTPGCSEVSLCFHGFRETLEEISN